MNTFEISVVVATRNRASSLARLLKGLAEQVYAPAFEIIISDNGSSDNTVRKINEASECLIKQYVRVDLPGKSRALNAAIKLARGDLIVFTDDDVLPQPDWLAELYAASCKFPECNIFGGRIEVNKKAVPGWIQKSFNLMGPLTSANNNGPAIVSYSYGTYPFGPNMAIRKHLLRGFSSPFPVHIGPGTSQPVGDESFFFVQFSPHHADDRLFVPYASVFHEIEPENVLFRPALTRCFLLGRCHAWLALPPVAQSPEELESVPKLILARLRTCQSIRELCCLSARFIGYRWGRHELRTGQIPGMCSPS